MSGNPTMNDVAKEAGVALKTVSRFVNGETNINSELAARISDAIVRLGYRRNLAAASIRPGRTSRTIGLITGDLANPYYSTLARAVEETVQESGYLLITSSTAESGALHDALVDRLMEQRVDGLIVVPPGHPGRPWREVAPPVPPVVFADRPGDFEGADTVLSDNRGGARSATAELLRQGARRIAFVGDDLGIYTMVERFAGHVDAMEAAGLEIEPDLVRSDARLAEDAARVVSELLVSRRAEAVFAANNRAALGSLLAFRSAGRRVPLIGFDDFEAALVASPEVSVVSQDIPAIGRVAAQMLLARLSKPDLDPKVKVIPTRLVLRGSERL